MRNSSARAPPRTHAATPQKLRRRKEVKAEESSRSVEPSSWQVIPVTDYGERPVFSCGGTEHVCDRQLRSLNQKRRRTK